jgi:uncharacterized protein YdeI (YjbR/CyaY-like superfamily)
MAKKIRIHVCPTSRKEWRQWLAKNHAINEGIWLVLAKKGSGLPSLTMAEAVEEALCFGWIDSTAGKVDENYFKVSFSPRNLKSNWSKINKDRVSRLVKARLMRAPGLKVIRLAKKNGQWEALNNVEKLEVPSDLRKALSKNKKAKTNFEKFPPSARKAILFWITSAKRIETREKRVAETVAQAEKNIRANQWTPKA